MDLIVSELSLQNTPIPLMTDQLGRTTFIGDLTGDNIPRPMVVENVVPTEAGLKSVVKRRAIEPAFTGIPGFTFAPDNTINIMKIQAADGEAYPAMYVDGNFLTLDPVTNLWQEVHNGTASELGPTTAEVQGRYFLYIKDLGLVEYDFDTNQFNNVTPNGIILSNIEGIASLNNYLLMWDQSRVYWSSPANALEFEPVGSDNIVTGANSALVTAATSRIMYILPANDYAVIYTNTNAVSMVYSNSANNPWVFNEIEDSGGVSTADHVTYANNSSVHFAWTSKGLQALDQHRARQVSPALSSFLRGNVFEVFDSTIEGTREFQYGTLRINLEYVNGRYLVISYGDQNKTDAGALKPYYYALIYDTALDAWGKIQHQHYAVADSSLILLYNALLIQEAQGAISSYGYLTIEESGGDLSDVVAKPESIYMMDKDGAFIAIDFATRAVLEQEEQDVISEKGFIYFAFEWDKQEDTTLHEIEYWGRDGDIEIDHWIVDPVTNVYQRCPVLNNPDKYNNWASGWTGKKHIIKIEGQFSLSSFVVKLTRAGYS